MHMTAAKIWQIHFYQVTESTTRCRLRFCDREPCRSAKCGFVSPSISESWNWGNKTKWCMVPKGATNMPWAGFPGMVLVPCIPVLWLTCLQAQPGLAAQQLSVQLSWPDHARSFHLFLWPSTLLHPILCHLVVWPVRGSEHYRTVKAGYYSSCSLPPRAISGWPPLKVTEVGPLLFIIRVQRWWSVMVLPWSPPTQGSSANSSNWFSALSSLSSDAVGCAGIFTL